MLLGKIHKNADNNVNKNNRKNHHAYIDIQRFPVFNYLIIFIAAQTLNSYLVTQKPPGNLRGLCNL